jgi:hypothetical protein
MQMETERQGKERADSVPTHPPIRFFMTIKLGFLAHTKVWVPGSRTRETNQFLERRTQKKTLLVAWLKNTSILNAGQKNSTCLKQQVQS